MEIFISLHGEYEERQNMAQIIAIMNDKGGVAKTTTTANLATALWLLGKKVLVVDTDQQCNLTQMMDKTSTLPAEDGMPMTMWEWLHDIQRVPVYERYPGLDYIPSSREMANASEYLFHQNRREYFLSKRLNSIRNEYDYILIDCIPGGKNLMNTNVLTASDAVIIPTEASFFSVQGTPNLMNFINEIRNDFEKELPVMGYLLIKYDKNTILGKQIKQFYQTPSDTLGGPLFPIQVRRCQRCNESPGSEQTLFEYAPDSTAADDYMMLAEFMIGRHPRPKKWTPATWGKKALDAFVAFQTLRDAQMEDMKKKARSV